MSPHSLLLSRPEAVLQQLLASSSLWSHSFCLQVQRLPQLPVPTTCLREPKSQKGNVLGTVTSMYSGVGG